jgi:hypothetical protein
VSGTVTQGGYGQTSGTGGWGRGGYTMMPGPAGSAHSQQPGDAMSASVVANGGGSFTLTLQDSTQGWAKTTRQTSGTAQFGSAEIIAEAPSDGQVLPLSDFGTDFTPPRTIPGWFCTPIIRKIAIYNDLPRHCRPGAANCANVLAGAGAVMARNISDICHHLGGGRKVGRLRIGLGDGGRNAGARSVSKPFTFPPFGHLE